MSERYVSLEVEDVEHGRVVSYTEICSLCRIDRPLLDAMIEHGVIEAGTSTGFDEEHLRRVTRAMSVLHDFDVSVDNLALVVDLLDKVRAQRREIDQLRKLVVRD